MGTPMELEFRAVHFLGRPRTSLFFVVRHKVVSWPQVIKQVFI